MSSKYTTNHKKTSLQGKLLQTNPQNYWPTHSPTTRDGSHSSVSPVNKLSLYQYQVPVMLQQLCNLVFNVVQVHIQNLDRMQYIWHSHQQSLQLFGSTVEPPLTDILYSRHLIIQDKVSRSRLKSHYTKYFSALWNVDTLLFCKADRFCSPASTWTVQNSLDNADAGRPLAQDCSAPLTDSPPAAGMVNFQKRMIFDLSVSSKIGCFCVMV